MRSIDVHPYRGINYSCLKDLHRAWFEGCVFKSTNGEVISNMDSYSLTLRGYSHVNVQYGLVKLPIILVRKI